MCPLENCECAVYLTDYQKEQNINRILISLVRHSLVTCEIVFIHHFFATGLAYLP